VEKFLWFERKRFKEIEYLGTCYMGSNSLNRNRELTEWIEEIGYFALNGLANDSLVIEERAGLPFKISRDNNGTWKRVQADKQYKKVLKRIHSIVTRWNTNDLTNLLCDFVYDLVRGFTPTTIFPPSTIDMAQARLYIQQCASVLVEDLTRKPEYEVIAPLYNLQMKCNRVQLGQFGIIRKARYSERRRYRLPLLYDNIKELGGEFEYVLDLSLDSEPISTFEKFKNRYFMLAGDVAFALRLVCGGDTGLVFIHFFNPESMATFFRSRKEEKRSFLMPPPPLAASRAIQPGQDCTLLEEQDVPKIASLLDWIYSLEENTSDFIWRAAKRYGNALSSRNEILWVDSYVIDMIIALECIYQGIRKQGHKRAAAFVTKNDESRCRVEDELLKCWRIRDVFVHGGWQSGMEKLGEKGGETLKLLTMTVRSSLLLCIAHQPRNRTSLLEMLDKYRNSLDSDYEIHTKIPKWVHDLALLESKVKQDC
jgi:hypothetical protein